MSGEPVPITASMLYDLVACSEGRNQRESSALVGSGQDYMPMRDCGRGWKRGITKNEDR